MQRSVFAMTAPEVIQEDDILRKAQSLLEPEMLAGESIAHTTQRVLRFRFSPSGRHTGIHGLLHVTNYRILFASTERSTYDVVHPNHSSSVQVDDSIPFTLIHAMYITPKLRSRASITSKTKPSGWTDNRIMLGSGAKYDMDQVSMLTIICKDMCQYRFNTELVPRDSRVALLSLLEQMMPSKLTLLFAFEHGQALHLHNNTIREQRLTYLKARLARLAPSSPSEVPLELSTLNNDFSICSTYPPAFVLPHNKSLHKSSAMNLNKLSENWTGRRFPVWSWTNSRTHAYLCRAGVCKGPVEADELIRFFGLKLLQTVNAAECFTVSEVAASWDKLRTLCLAVLDGKADAMSSWLSGLESTNWMRIVRKCLVTAASIASKLENNYNIVLTGSEEGDADCLIASLVQVISDPYARTFKGFEELIEVEWVGMGFPFGRRLCHLSTDNVAARSPVFALFLDCVFQVLRQNPHVFQFTEEYLLQLRSRSHTCLYGTFLLDCDYDRCETAAISSTKSVWVDLPGDSDIEAVRQRMFSMLYAPYPGTVMPHTKTPNLEFWQGAYLHWLEDVHYVTAMTKRHQQELVLVEIRELLDLREYLTTKERPKTTAHLEKLIASGVAPTAVKYIPPEQLRPPEVLLNPQAAAESSGGYATPRRTGAGTGASTPGSATAGTAAAASAAAEPLGLFGDDGQQMAIESSVDDLMFMEDPDAMHDDSLDCSTEIVDARAMDD
eukprot:m.143905 g.143905  ORF g.143905 m.143905 type:complete len:724 (+) comp16753_c1_seq1:193-2364(+)